MEGGLIEPLALGVRAEDLGHHYRLLDLEHHLPTCVILHAAYYALVGACLVVGSS